MGRKKTAGQKLVQALREAGFQFDEVFTVKPTEGDLRRMKDSIVFIRELEKTPQATKNSTLHLG